MANLEDSSGGKRKKRSIRIDMTPMVDLGFLLITFFVFTASMGESKAMRLVMPADGPPSTLSELNAITILPDSNRILLYEGGWANAIRGNTIRELSMNQIRELIIAKTKELKKRGRNEKLMVVIKPFPGSSYGTIVNILDEMLICEVPSYAIVEPSPEESSYQLYSKY